MRLYNCTVCLSQLILFTWIFPQCVIALCSLSERKYRPLVPTWQDVELLEQVVEILSPFNVLTDLLSGDQHTTSSAVVPTLLYVRDLTEVDDANDNPLAIKMKGTIREYLSEKLVMFLLFILAGLFALQKFFKTGVSRLLQSIAFV